MKIKNAARQLRETSALELDMAFTISVSWPPEETLTAKNAAFDMLYTGVDKQAKVVVEKDISIFLGPEILKNVFAASVTVLSRQCKYTSI